MKDMILFPEDIDRLNVILEQLAAKANLLLAVLINKDGRLLTYQGSLEKIDTVSMAALVAGNSASTLAIANLMGETEFSAMYHQGKNRHIFIEVVDENTFLCLIFDDRTNIDRVKVFARQFDRQIKAALVQVYDKTEDQVDLDLDMGFSQPQNQQAATAPSAQDFHPEPAPSSAYFGPPEQPATSLLQPEPIDVPFSSTLQDNSTKSGLKHHTPQSVPTDEEPFMLEAHLPQPAQAPGDKISEEVHDTNYLYLKKKIRETVNKKK